MCCLSDPLYSVKGSVPDMSRTGIFIALLWHLAVLIA